MAIAISRASAEEVPRFNRDVRPILSENCFGCHGPDSAARKGQLRLDQMEGATRGGKSGKPAIAPGRADASELLRRIHSDDPDEQMPPPKSGKRLSAAQKSVLRSWIAEGAVYEKHWAFLPLRSPQVPTVLRRAWVRNPIDAFVLARLEQEGINPSPEAAPATLQRRLSLDLNGLSPSLAEQSAFQEAYARHSEDTLRHTVRALLLSPRYGEHMAIGWMDLARYADTSGFQGDPYRSMWRWRDYVIQSFNANKRFDQFTIEQLAGDLLPHPSIEQRLATGFQRNHRFNTEFGAINEEWLFEYAVDRVETTGATWLGLTLGCARCHDHKFDPVTQPEFYQFAAFFQNIPERGVYWDGNEVAFKPSMRAPNAAEEKRLEELRAKARARESDLAELAGSEEIASEQHRWESSRAAAFARELRRWTSPGARSEAGLRTCAFPTNLVAHFSFDGTLDGAFGRRIEITTNSTTSTNILSGETKAIFTQSRVQTNRYDFSKLMRPTRSDAAVYGPGRMGMALRVATSSPALEIPRLLDRSRATFAFWLKPETEDGAILQKLGEQDLFHLGFLLSLTRGRVHLELHHKIFDFDATMVPMEFTTTQILPLRKWTHVAIALDGKRRDRGPVIYIDGVAQVLEPLKATARGLNAITNREPFWIGGDQGRPGVEGWIDDFWAFDRPLSESEIQFLRSLPGAHQLAARGNRASQARPDSPEALQFYQAFLSEKLGAARSRLAQAVREAVEFERALPEVMVMAENPSPAASRVLFRGQYDAPREEVRADIPSSLGRLPADAPRNRLGLAKWLVSDSNPLTARVVMNRLWEQFFGAGLVRASENLGSQSDPPTHPELLDWLASEFVRGGWDLQAMIRLIVSSSTYRQSSAQRADLAQRDPDNRLLARAGRFRLSAEAVRDQALSVSGALQEKIGGPSVTVYLPGETPAESPDLYRRSLYAFWQRTRFNPSFGTFDAPSREACTVKRPRTNTPLQALALLNEVTYVEAARKLAEAMIRESADARARLSQGFQRALGRSATPEELETLERSLGRFLERYKSDRAAAEALVRFGASKPDPKIDAPTLAAYTLMASELFNLDEFITRE
ncbi:MAG: DUF1553 domain-containing protein [Verrucomicrobia bacterium]|nr:DUF1553 domain-containing protein [Verrucomicrobiota bacterium]MBI3868027.1 DUF1553 domain-containing protein [Verrucomicrobiota bacterium]